MLFGAFFAMVGCHGRNVNDNLAIWSAGMQTALKSIHFLTMFRCAARPYGCHFEAILKPTWGSNWGWIEVDFSPVWRMSCNGSKIGSEGLEERKKLGFVSVFTVSEAKFGYDQMVANGGKWWHVLGGSAEWWGPASALQTLAEDAYSYFRRPAPR